MSSIAVLGDGAWGTAVALLLVRNRDCRVTLWSARPENARILRETRENRSFLPGVPLPDSLRLTEDPAEAVSGSTLWFSAIPTVYLRETLGRFRHLVQPNTSVCSLTKGIEIATFQRPTEIIQDVFGIERVAVLSGPTHAEEVSRGQPTSAVVAGLDALLTAEIQSYLNTDRFRVYTNSDPIGVELAGALKNVMGIAAGISDGLQFGDNAKSALLTRALVEMTRFGVAHGAESATFSGLAGMGDLITTCFSQHGRNRRVGELLGRGQTLQQILASSPAVVEGVTTARSVHDRCQRLGLDMPIAEAVYRVLYQGLSPREGLAVLMSRKLGSEKAGNG